MDDSTIVRINLLLKKFGKKFQPFASNRTYKTCIVYDVANEHFNKSSCKSYNADERNKAAMLDNIIACNLQANKESQVLHVFVNSRIDKFISPPSNRKINKENLPPEPSDTLPDFDILEPKSNVVVVNNFCRFGHNKQACGNKVGKEKKDEELYKKYHEVDDYILASVILLCLTLNPDMTVKIKSNDKYMSASLELLLAAEPDNKGHFTQLHRKNKLTAKKQSLLHKYVDETYLGKFIFNIPNRVMLKTQNQPTQNQFNLSDDEENLSPSSSLSSSSSDEFYSAESDLAYTSARGSALSPPLRSLTNKTGGRKVTKRNKHNKHNKRNKRNNFTKRNKQL